MAILTTRLTIFSKFNCFVTVPIKNSTRYYSKRTLLLTPGNHASKLQKSLKLKTDCLVMDLEDGVFPNDKAEARANIRKILDKGLPITYGPELCVRINSVSSGLCHNDLLAILFEKYLPESIILSKVETEDDLQWFSEALWKNLLERGDESHKKPLKVLIAIESAQALMDLPILCKKLTDLSTMAPIQPAALVMGANSLLADLNCQRTKYRMELLYARQKLVAVAKAFKLGAIDMPCLNYRDPGEFQQEIRESVAMGFTGKILIHPNQVPVAEECFKPTKEQLEWAVGLLETCNTYHEKGERILTYKGEYIDMGIIRQAQQIIDSK